MIIFDELEYVKEILRTGIQTKHINFEIQLIANYYREQGYEDKQIEEELHKFCKEYISNYNKVNFYKFIDEKVIKSKKSSLKKSYPIDITKSELDLITSESNYKCKKLMFVYLVLAKYYMSNNHTEKYYVGCNDNDIFKLCNMYVRSGEKIDLMHYLTKMQYITPTLNMSSIVNYVNENSEIVFTLVPEIDMVYYFEKYLGGNIIYCENCGKLTKKNSNRQKYCNKCSREINIKNAIDLYHN